MPSVYDDNNFSGRVNYAYQCIMRNPLGRVPQGRAFDTCFEMWDGDCVAEALRRKALTNPDFDAKLQRVLSPHSLPQVKEWLGHLTAKQLRERAARDRRESQARTDAEFEAMQVSA